jgi:GGDEF domain-containing protein
MAGAGLIVNLADSIDSYGPCAAAFQPSTEDTSALLTVLGDFSRNSALSTNTRVLFDGLLSNFLKLTDSEYGFIGERLLRPDETLFLKTHAITNIAWDEATLAFYKEHAPKGMEFDNLNSLFGHVIRTARPLISNDPATDHRAAFLGIPLFLGDQCLGMAGIANRPGGYDAELSRHLNPLISSTAALIHAAHRGKVASHDPLTGLANRKKFDERFAAEVSRHNRHGNDLSLLLIDVDSFKSINDTFGHLVGDHCLVQVAEILYNRVRAEDLVARYGGRSSLCCYPTPRRMRRRRLLTSCVAPLAATRLRHLKDRNRLRSQSAWGSPRWKVNSTLRSMLCSNAPIRPCTLPRGGDEIKCAAPSCKAWTCQA